MQLVREFTYTYYISVSVRKIPVSVPCAAGGVLSDLRKNIYLTSGQRASAAARIRQGEGMALQVQT